MGILEKLLVSLAVGILKWWADRQALKDQVKGEIAKEAYDRARAAYEWKADAASRPDGGAGLRVREGTGPVTLLPREDPGANGKSEHHQL